MQSGGDQAGVLEERRVQWAEALPRDVEQQGDREQDGGDDGGDDGLLLTVRGSLMEAGLARASEPQRAGRFARTGPMRSTGEIETDRPPARFTQPSTTPIVGRIVVRL